MSDYKHIYNAIDHAMRHLQQAQECCDDTMHLDKEACGTWKKQIKEAEKALKGCYKKVESKHKKASSPTQTKIASSDENKKSDLPNGEQTLYLNALDNLLNSMTKEEIYEDIEFYQDLESSIISLNELVAKWNDLDYNVWYKKMDRMKSREYQTIIDDPEQLNRDIEKMNEIKTEFEDLLKNTVQDYDFSLTEKKLKPDTLKKEEMEEFNRNSSRISRLKKVANNADAKIVLENKKFLKDLPKHISNEDKKLNYLFVVTVDIDGLKKPLEADVNLLNDTIYMYEQGKYKDELIASIPFRTIQPGELLENYFDEVTETVQQHYKAEGVEGINEEDDNVIKEDVRDLNENAEEEKTEDDEDFLSDDDIRKLMSSKSSRLKKLVSQQ